MVYNKELVATSSLFFVPIYILYINDKPIPYIFSDLIFLQGYISMLFWWNPIKGGIVHKIDRLLARISISSVIIYKIYKEPTPLFVTNIIIMFLFFKVSNICSKKNWCSKWHILWHGFAHIYAHNAIYWAFL
jgi:hypothetical protein